MPNPCGPWNASPESFRSILSYAGFALFAALLLLVVVFIAAMSLREESLKIPRIVTNYLLRRTLADKKRAPGPARSALKDCRGRLFYLFAGAVSGPNPEGELPLTSPTLNRA